VFRTTTAGGYHQSMFKPALTTAALASTLLLGTCNIGCSTSPKDEAGKQILASETQALLTRYKAEDPTLASVLDASVGYVIFPSIGKGGIGIGGAYGRGEVYEKGARIGYADMTQATIGLQLGGQEYAELLVFRSAEKFANFRSGNFAFTADASAVAISAGAAAATKFEGGVGVFTISKAGLMYQATLGGQRFTYQAVQ
jgi:lipid-binding SYLF domain-containing protein